jgi:hypothetical protein
MSGWCARGLHRDLNHITDWHLVLLSNCCCLPVIVKLAEWIRAGPRLPARLLRGTARIKTLSACSSQSESWAVGRACPRCLRRHLCADSRRSRGHRRTPGVGPERTFAYVGALLLARSAGGSTATRQSPIPRRDAAHGSLRRDCLERRGCEIIVRSHRRPIDPWAHDHSWPSSRPARCVGNVAR